MTLVAWYPLNGDSNDISGRKNHLTGTITYIDSGKIGKAIDCNTGVLTWTLNDDLKRVFSGDQFTIALWWKQTGTPGDWQDIIQYTDVNGIVRRLGIENATSNPGKFTYWINIGKGDTTYSGAITYDFNNVGNTDEWIHLAFVRDGIKFKVYKNGIKYKEVNAVGDIQLINSDLTIATHSNTNSYLNDVRFYDNALSDKEIYEISKAKILHYTFNDFQEPTENVIPDGDFSSKTLQSVYSNCVRGTLTFVDDNTAPISNVALKHEATDDDSFTGPHSGTSAFLHVASINETWTVSVYVRGEAGGENIQLYIMELDSSGNLLRDANQSFNVTVDWQRIAYTTTLTNSSTAYISARLDNNYTGQIVYWNGWQLEKKDRATPFVNGSREGIVKDVSGYGNDATLNISTTPKWIEDSKLGSGCYYFDNKPLDGSTFQYIRSDNTVYIPRQGTLSAWIRGTTDNQPLDNIYPFGWEKFCTLGPNGGTSDSRAGMIYYYDVSTYTSTNWGGQGLYDGNWHLYTITWDADNQLMSLYIDGVKIGGTSSTNVLYHAGTFRYFNVGSAWAVTYGGHGGEIDDVRAYATILSDEDIKKLYQTKAVLDNKGNLHVNKIEDNIESYDPTIKNINLVENGNGEYGSNFNFSGWTYNSSESSFETSAYQSIKYSDIYIPVNTNYKYKLEGLCKNLNASAMGKLYFGVACYDKNKKFIQHRECTFFPSSHTTLAQDLNDGDTIVYLTDASGWDNTDPGNYNYRKHFVHWYNSEYVPYTYSEVAGDVHYLDVDYTANTITLQNPWSGGTIPAGTPVANGYDGGTYNYIAADNVIPPTNWTKYTGYIGPGEGGGDGSIFRYGTKYIKLLFLVNRLVSGSSLGIKNLKFYNADTIQHALYENLNIALKPESIYKSNLFNEVGPSNGLINWWKLRGDARDYGSGAIHGTVYGNPTFSSGLKEVTYNFDGTDDYIDLGQTIDLDKMGSTLAFWLNVNTMTNMSIFGITSSTGTINMIEFRQTFFWCESNVNCNNFNSPTLPQTVNAGEWNHFVVKFDNNRCYWYMNGEFIGETPDYGTYNCDASQPLSEMADNFKFRYIGSGSYGSLLNGKLQDVRLYNRALSDEEIKILYKVTSGNTKMIQSREGIIYISGHIKEGL